MNYISVKVPETFGSQLLLGIISFSTALASLANYLQVDRNNRTIVDFHIAW